MDADRTLAPRRTTLARAVALLLLAAALPALPGERYAVEVRFPPAPGSLESMPVVLTGAELHRLTGAALPVCSSIEAALNGERRACQVDEKNGTGRWAASNGVLDHDDELAFYTDLVKGEPATLVLAWTEADGARATTPPAAAGPVDPDQTVKITEEHKIPYVELWLETEQFRLGMNAEGADDPEAHDIGNYGRAAFSVVEFRGKSLTAIRSGWANVLPRHAFGYGAGPFRWSKLKVVRRGPVRTIVETERSDYENGVRAEFAVYTRGPAIDLAYSMRYVKLEPEPQRQPQGLGFGYPMRLGAKGDVNDVLLVPVAGRVDKHRLTPENIAAFYPTYYETPLPQEGWFAWADTAENVGLAVFFEAMAPIRDRAAWFDSRPPCNPEVRVRTIPGGAPENSVTWRRRNTHTARSWTTRNRLVALTDDDADRVRLAYRLWALPLEELAEVSLPETRTK